MSRVEVLVECDPDSAGTVRVFIDGVEVQAEDHWVDPGRGHMLSEWREYTRYLATSGELTPAYRDAVVDARDQVEKSAYIEDDLPASEAAHQWQQGRLTGAVTCAVCGLLPLDQDDVDTMCRSRSATFTCGCGEHEHPLWPDAEDDSTWCECGLRIEQERDRHQAIAREGRCRMYLMPGMRCDGAHGHDGRCFKVEV